MAETVEDLEVLGALARELLRRQAHHALGFARVDDTARARRGLSGHELQSAAQVVEAPDRRHLSPTRS